MAGALAGRGGGCRGLAGAGDVAGAVAGQVAGGAAGLGGARATAGRPRQVAGGPASRPRRGQESFMAVVIAVEALAASVRASAPVRTAVM
ncbi:hypothetical protein GCM10010423_04670 [Streptomyces levis]|uniref:Uncharacterized protein n=1 Tax=Streptomyces levis TaxID=285566 RepID=A0ABN3N828_9ACTN